MPKATSGEWARYYSEADQRRELKGDPIEQYMERAHTKEKRHFIGFSALLVAVVIAFCVLLAR